MTTRPDERLAYRDLARQGARVTRSLQADEFPRLHQVAPMRGPLNVVMEFSLDGNGRPWVCGHAEVPVAVSCQRCMESGDVTMRAEFELCIVRDEAEATALAEDADVVTVAGSTLSVADVVEDELLLGLPERLCRVEPCPNLPALSYPAEPAPDEEPADNPFSVLQRVRDELKR